MPSVSKFLICSRMWLDSPKELLALRMFLFQLSKRSTKLGVKSQTCEIVWSKRILPVDDFRMPSLAKII